MKHLFTILIACLFVPALLQGQTLPVQNRNLMWYEEPATGWKEALPLGNSQMGACLYGAPGTEQIRLVSADGKCIGNLRITTLGQEYYSNYRRTLDLDSAMAVVEYQVPSEPGMTGVQTYFRCRREAFVPMGQQVLVMRIKTEAPQGLSFVAQFSLSKEQGEEAVLGIDNRLKVVLKEGLQMERDGAVYVSGAKEAVLYFALKEGLPSAVAQAVESGAEKLLADHVAQYQSAADVQTLWLGADAQGHRPYKFRVKRALDEDKALAGLWYRLGRYMSVTGVKAGEANYADWSKGIDETLVSTQSADIIDILPSLPENMKNEGRYICTVDGLQLDMEWKAGEVTRLAVTSPQSGSCLLRCPTQLKGKGLKQMSNQTNAYLYNLKFKAGVPSILTRKK